MPKISVVVPIYNVENYLNKCLTSLAEQSLEKHLLQVILVDDGSNDSSGIIADRYAEQNTNFEVYHTKNQGVSLSRKFGVTRASGEYIGFVDGDDYCDTTMFQKMLKIADTNDLEILACRNYSFSERGINTTIASSSYEDTLMSSYDKVFNSVIVNTIIDGTESVVLWNKLYKRSLFTDYNVDFGKNILEDYLVNMQCFKHINRFMQISDPLYYYRISSNSLSRTFKKEIFDILLEIQEYKEKIFADEFTSDRSLMIKADKWFIKYVESILKSLYLFGSKSFDLDEYAQHMLEDPTVIFKVRNLVSSGEISPFVKRLYSGRIRKQIAYTKLFASVYKTAKTFKR